jgi:hypothetical protein
MRRGRKDILVMMKCQKCNGRVFVDSKRWMINKETRAFGKWLEKTDKDYAKSSSISS